MLTGVVLGRGQGGRDRLHAGRGEVPVYVIVCGFARKNKGAAADRAENKEIR